MLANPFFNICSNYRTDRKTGRQKDRKTERQKDRKTERHKDRKTERQKDRKTEMLELSDPSRVKKKCLSCLWAN